MGALTDTGRQLILDRVLRDAPHVHDVGSAAAPAVGLWASERDCYEFLAEHCPPGTRSLETGSGLSTILLAALGAVHTCVTPSAAECERIRAHCDERGIDLSTVDFRVGGSEVVLPALEPTALDLVFIDGCHGFPAPTIDWFYAGSRLRRGGVLMLDDTQLPAIAQLERVLGADPRWSRAGGSARWGAWERTSEGPLMQEWIDQSWFTLPLSHAATSLSRRGLARVRRMLARSDR